jgi:hypothetical protein
VSAVAAVWRIRHGRPVGRLHLRSEFWTSLRKDRAVATQCGQAFEDGRGEKHEPLTVEWSCDPAQWPDLPRCGHCVKASPFIRRSLLSEIETLDTFTQTGARPWLSREAA